MKEIGILERPTIGIAVDCGCSGNPGNAEYQAVDIQTKKVLFEYKIPGLCTNNIAEFAALVVGVNYLIDNNLEGKVYSDSQTALAWYKHKKHKSLLEKRPSTTCAHNILNKSIALIPKENHMQYVEFWNNKKWGENYADYGRK